MTHYLLRKKKEKTKKPSLKRTRRLRVRDQKKLPCIALRTITSFLHQPSRSCARFLSCVCAVTVASPAPLPPLATLLLTAHRACPSSPRLPRSSGTATRGAHDRPLQLAAAASSCVATRLAASTDIYSPATTQVAACHRA